MALGILFNQKNCYGCKTCQMSCITNTLPGNENTFPREVNMFHTGTEMCGNFLSMACNHCENPACVANCPQGAYVKCSNGIVKQDHSKCIGCKTCVTACPYHAPKFDEASKTVYKCDMCYDRLARGEKPACVEACPGANLVVDEVSNLKAQYPDAVSDIAGVLPSSAETQPNIYIIQA